MEPTTEPTQPAAKGGKSYYVTIDQFVSEAKTALTNGQLADIEPLLASRGYPKTLLAAKANDVDSLATLNEKQKKEYGESAAATDDYTQAVALLHPDYIDHLGLARIGLKAQRGRTNRPGAARQKKEETKPATAARHCCFTTVCWVAPTTKQL